MATSGQEINKTSIGSGVAYSVSGDTSTSYISYVFGNSIWWEVETGTASNIYAKHPAVSYGFYRYSISQQQWVTIYTGSQGKSSSTVFRVRNNQMPSSGTVRAEYNGDDSYLFAFKAYTYEGERSRTTERLLVYDIGADTTYDSYVKGKFIYGRNEDYAYKWHLNTSLSSFSLTDNWLKTDAMAGTQITPSHVHRMISVKSATSFT